MTGDELEAKRSALLAEIVPDEPLTDDQRLRVAEIAGADLERAAQDQTIQGHLHRDLGAQIAELFASAGITDTEPGMTAQATEDGTGTELFVTSRSRGRVSIGTLPFLVVNARAGAIAVPYAEALEAKRKAPLDAKRRQKNANVRRAAELSDAGNSVPRIAQIMSDERGKTTDARTVRAWLADRKTRMDREPSG